MKLKPEDGQLLKLIDRWRHRAIQAGHEIERVVVAYEAGRGLMRAFLGWLRGEKRHCSMIT